MKKIIIILPSFEMVSPVKASFALAKGLKDEFEIEFISINSSVDIKNSLETFLGKENFKYEYLNKNGMKNIFKAKKVLESILFSKKPDIIISYLLRADIIVSLLKTNAKKISSVRNMIDKEYIISHGKFVGVFFGLIHKIALKKFDKLILISRDMKLFFKENGFNENKLVLIQNFLDEPDVKIRSKEEVLLPFNNDFPTIVSISSLIKRKNIIFLINNSLELFEEGYKFNVLIIGKGNEENILKSLVEKSKYKNNFIFTGYINNPLPYLKLVDYFVMTSLSEGVSRSLMEALYFNKKCIVSDIDGNRELIKHNENGFLFKSKKDFKEILKKNLSNQIEIKNKELLPYSFSYVNGIKQTKKLIKEELK